MRVTESIVFRQATHDIGQLRSSLFDLQRQGSTGQKFHGIGDEPTAAERIRLLREAKEATIHYGKNITRSRTQLEAADSALGEATNLVIRAKEIALQTATETISAEERTIVAEEIASLYQSMLGLANTEAAGEFIFGGYQTQTAPFQTNGTYIGDSGVKEVEVGPNARQIVNVSGERAFTVAGGLDVFGEIDGLYQALLNNDIPAIQASLDTMDVAATQLSNARTDAGLKLNQLDVASGVRDRLEDSLGKEESQLLDIDPVEVFLELNATSKALDNAIRVSQKVTSTSLLGM